jgi:hypothetical protein
MSNKTEYVDTSLGFRPAAAPTSPAEGETYVDQSTGKQMVFQQGRWTQLVGADSRQTLTRKDIDGGNASNTSRITIPKANRTKLDTLARKEASIWWAKDEKKAYIDTGLVLQPIGSGSGDTNELIERLQIRLQNSTFGRLTDNIFANAAETKIASKTATYDLASAAYKFTAGSQNIVSTQSLSSQFLAKGRNVPQVELIAYWLASAVDSSATYDVSRDGGASWQAVTMAAMGTETYRGTLQFTAESNQTLHTNAVGLATGTTTLNASTTQRLAQKVVLSQTELVRNITLYMNKTGASTGGYFRVLLVADSAGAPGTTTLSDSGPVSIAPLSTGNITVSVTMPDAVLTAGTYWFIIQTDAIYLSDATVGYSAGVRELAVRNFTDTSSASSYNGTVWAAIATTSFVYQMNGIVLDLRVRVTSGATGTLVGYGILYDTIDAPRTTGLPIERVVQPANTTSAQFTLTKFVPDPDLLEVTCIETCKTYLYGAFQLQGQTVIFPDETFLSAQSLNLTFRQLKGSSFDSTDRNAQLLAANFLGSTDATIDRSQAGRGIFLRRPDGTLREVAIDNSDNIVVFSV